MVCMILEVYVHQFHLAPWNHGFVKLVKQVYKILLVNYVLILVCLLFITFIILTVFKMKYFVLGGIFKETDCGKWVHLVCALYVPGISFGEVTSLSKVMLFSNTTPRWGGKSCCLCKDVRFMCTGVTIACDAGMCRSNFHVTWYV